MGDFGALLMSLVIPAIGSTCLGIVIGWLVRYFLLRFKKFTPSVLSSVVSLSFGGVALKFIGGNSEIIWFYPIGVLIGFFVYTLTAALAIRAETKAAVAAAAVAKSHGIAGGGGGGIYRGPIYK